MTTEPKDAKPTGKAPQANVPRLMQALKSVNDKAPDAARNKTSISDNRGRRIELDDRTVSAKNIIRGEEKLSGTIYGEEN